MGWSGTGDDPGRRYRDGESEYAVGAGGIIKAKRQPQVAVFSFCTLSLWERGGVRASGCGLFDKNVRIKP
ncbi:hypothetical protein DEO48_16775 [Enterobacter sp. CGMCC 5087]|nr:hypothetical protein DEO48_16775 [Enterobacter sp. CGMCC 5087]